ncbi:hypothetical protein [Aureibacillus halotolerans]|uniref:Uncharacterized protein n=1 Tax=Aureibacillus halotolerans TaxID=1508390 RepID=A0A4V3D585_9BACI|nr:hypothetical protein [Aureibacillus halotolerans]TDQ39117.1 hypothetical protein EV213_10864 [Aureibacillus halotolerans]
MWRVILIGAAIWLLFTSDHPWTPDNLPKTIEQFQLKIENAGEMSLFQKHGEDGYLAFAPDELQGKPAEDAVNQVLDRLTPKQGKSTEEYLADLKELGYTSIESFQMLLHDKDGLFSWIWPNS